MATITTTQHQRTPLWMALAVAGALVVGGAVGVAIDQSNDQPVSSPTPAVSTFHAAPWWVGAYQHYYKGMSTSSQPQAKTFGTQL